MAKIIEDAARHAHRVTPPTTEGLPEIKLPVQETVEHERLLGVTNVPDLGFPVIDGKEFQAKKLSFRLGIPLPRFGFFSVEEKPRIEGVVRCGYDKEPSFEWTQNKYQPTNINPNDTFGFFERLWLQHSALIMTALVWTIAVAFMSFGYTLVAELHEGHFNKGEMFLVSVTIASLPVAAGIGGFLNSINLRRTAEVRYSVELHQIIPQEVVDIINRHYSQQIFSHGIYIVADVTDKWKMSKECAWTFGRCKSDIDPLIVGVHNVQGLYTYHLIHKFDLTAAEAYIK